MPRKQHRNPVTGTAAGTAAAKVHTSSTQGQANVRITMVTQFENEIGKLETRFGVHIGYAINRQLDALCQVNLWYWNQANQQVSLGGPIVGSFPMVLDFIRNQANSRLLEYQSQTGTGIKLARTGT